VPAAQAAQLLQMGSRTVVIVAPAPQIVDEHLARRRQPHAARPAFEERHAELRFKIEDVAIDCRG
jgi:hypothetical protein